MLKILIHILKINFLFAMVSSITSFCEPLTLWTFVRLDPVFNLTQMKMSL